VTVAVDEGQTVDEPVPVPVVDVDREVDRDGDIVWESEDVIETQRVALALVVFVCARERSKSARRAAARRPAILVVNVLSSGKKNANNE